MHDWANVMDLRPGAVIRVTIRDGSSVAGKLLWAGIDSLRIGTSGTERRILRVAVFQIDVLRFAGSTAGALAKGAAKGAVWGALTIWCTLSLVGGDAWPFPEEGRLIARTAAYGAALYVPFELLDRRPRTVYKALRPFGPDVGHGCYYKPGVLLAELVVVLRAGGSACSAVGCFGSCRGTRLEGAARQWPLLGPLPGRNASFE